LYNILKIQILIDDNSYENIEISEIKKFFTKDFWNNCKRSCFIINGKIDDEKTNERHKSLQIIRFGKVCGHDDNGKIH
jgi:hypothetical protein